MSPSPEEELREIQEELKWISVKEDLVGKKSRNSLKIFDILVPAGCAVTVGVLGTGIFHMYKSRGRKQQLFMRYRVLAQGVTIALASAGMFLSRMGS